MGRAEWDSGRLSLPDVHLESLFVEEKHQRTQAWQWPDRRAPAAFEALIRHKGREVPACLRGNW